MNLDIPGPVTLHHILSSKEQDYLLFVSLCGAILDGIRYILDVQ